MTSTTATPAAVPRDLGKTPVPARRGRRRSRRLTHIADFFTFGFPGLAVYFGLVLLPILMMFRTGLTDRNLLRPKVHNVGFANFHDLFADHDFTGALKHTIILSVIAAVLSNVIGLGVALMLDRRSWFYNMLRSVFFVPVVLSWVVTSVIWSTILVDDGLLNTMLRGLGVDHPPGWLSDPDIALYTVSLVGVWQGLGFAVVVYLAGLAGIPNELYEAAAIDGAGPFARFRKITWPMLAPALTINVVITLIGGLKAFDQIKVMTNGGPGNGVTNTIAFQVVQTTFNDNHIGYGAAMATLMLLFIASITIVVLRLLQRREVAL